MGLMSFESSFARRVDRTHESEGRFPLREAVVSAEEVEERRASFLTFTL